MKLLEIFVSFFIMVCDTRRPFSSAAVLDDMDNCSWSEWGSWTTCSLTCGSSVMKRVRAKDIGTCNKKYNEYETEHVNCPVDECPSDYDDDNDKEKVEAGARKSDIPFKSLGCWKDSIPRALASAEGNSSFLNGHYRRREHPIQECYVTAKSLGRQIFAIQDGGQCFTSEGTQMSHQIYGPSSDCKDDGEGGPMANEVYEIPSECRDINSMCSGWKKEGYCNSPDYWNFMKKNCKHSCNLCGQ